ncbi:MAG TPA: hypothetical protein VGW74_03875, partial [Propionibacteriaceae bacterium]|nr:hypothetical protein [Propionibacteriaceae bacterium]
MDPPGVGLVGEGVVRSHLGQLRAGKNDDLGLHAQVLGDGALERRGDRRGVGFLAGEDHVAALNVGRHLGGP